MKHDYFDHWSSEMAYYLGWLWADGNISDGKLQIGCVTEDEELVVNFMKAIESHHKIIRQEGFYHKKGYWVKPYTKSAIYSKELIGKLVGKHGLLPRKTYLDCEFPFVEEKYMRSFLRGYCDGDGSLFMNKCNLICVSIVGTKKFMKGFGQHIHNLTGIPLHPLYQNSEVKSPEAGWYLGWAKRTEVLAFLDFIYSEEPALTKKKHLATCFSGILKKQCDLKGIGKKGNSFVLRLFNLRLGTYRIIEECWFAREYAHQKSEGFRYPVSLSYSNIKASRKREIIRFIDNKFSGKNHCPDFNRI